MIWVLHLNQKKVLFENTKMKLCVTDNDYMLDGIPCKNMRVNKCAYKNLDPFCKTC